MKMLSIIIPVYNAENYLLRCLNSIVSQECFIESVELIIVDDGSKDGSLKKCSEYALMCENVILITSDHSGVSKARNLGIERATCDYIMFVDADDYLLPTSLNDLMTLMKSQELDMVLADVKKIDFTGKVISDNFASKAGVYDIGQIRRILYDYLKDPRGKNLLSFVWNKIFLRRIIEENKLRFDTNLVVNEDALFVFQYISHISTLGYLKNYTYCYCTNTINIGTNRMRDNPLAFDASLVVVKRLLNEYENEKELTSAYYNAFATLAIRNIFHLIRCSTDYEKLWKDVAKILENGKVRESMNYYIDKKRDNFAIIPFLIKHKMTFSLIFLFKLQIYIKQRSKK